MRNDERNILLNSINYMFSISVSSSQYQRYHYRYINLVFSGTTWSYSSSDVYKTVIRDGRHKRGLGKSQRSAIVASRNVTVYLVGVRLMAVSGVANMP